MKTNFTDGENISCIREIQRRRCSPLNFFGIQDLPLFLRCFGALKRKCSELHDRRKGKDNANRMQNNKLA